MLHIFLSHVRDDGVLARRLAEALKRAGHQPLLVEDEATVGDSALDVLERCLGEADVAICCLSRAALADAWMQTEFQTVLSRLGARGRPVLAVRFERVLPQGDLARKPAIDLLPDAGGWEEGNSTLVEVLGRFEKGAAEKEWSLLLGLPREPDVFVDREEILRQLHEVLEPHAVSTEERRATLLGAGGMGKTAIALRFAREAISSFPGGVWWCEERGRTPNEALAWLFWEIRRLAPLATRAPLDFISPGATTDELVAAVRRALGAEQPSLLIINDAAELPWEGHLPEGPVSVLMIRRVEQGAIGRKIPVEPLSLDDALQLVDTIAPPPEEPQEREARVRVVKQIGGNPLALGLVGSLAKSGVRWSTVELDLRAQADQEHGSGKPLRIGVLVDEALSRCTPVMRHLLEMMASFAAAPIPADWIIDSAQDDEEIIQFERAGQELLNLGLIDWNGHQRTLSLHPLVQKRVRQQIEAGEREKILSTGMAVIERWLRPRIPLIRPEHAGDLEPYLPHLLEILDATHLQPPSRTWIRLAVEVSTVLKFHSQYSAAIELLERALGQAEQLQEAFYQLNCLVDLAFALYEMGMEQSAAPYVQRALSIVERLPKSPDLELANGLNKLAIFLRKKEPWLAKQLAERALRITEDSFGPDSEKTAIVLGNLAGTTHSAEGAEAAIPLYQRALELIERHQGQDSSFVAKLAEGLALAFVDIGDLANARAYMEKAVATDARLLPPDHPEVAGRLESLAFILSQLGEFASAKQLLKRTVAMMETKFGVDHPGLARALHNLGSVMLKLGEIQTAEAVLLRAVSLEEAGLAPDDPLIASTRMGLAAAADSRGDRKTAVLHLERALDTGMTLYAPEPGASQPALEKALRLARGREVNAEAYVSGLREALDVAEREGDLANAARAALLLGAFEGRRGAWETARHHVEQGLRLAKQADASILVAESHRLLGDASLHGSRYEDARLHYAEAIRRLDELGLSARAARVRMLLVVMMLQLGRSEGLETHAAALRTALQEGRFTEPAERTEVEQVLRLVDAARQGASAEQPGSKQ